MKQQRYETMIAQIKALLEGEHDMIANMANLSAILYHSLPDINWAGFYLYKKDVWNLRKDLNLAVNR